MHKILLVEDDETIRQQVKIIMEQWGFEVIAVDDFMDVLGTFVQTNPHFPMSSWRKFRDSFAALMSLGLIKIC